MLAPIIVTRRHHQAALQETRGLSATIPGNSGRVVRDPHGQQGAPRPRLSQREILEQRGALLQSTLEHMEEGVSVFDRDGRLVVWNSRFVELLGLPSNLSDDISLADILWLQARRGDFGPVDPAEAVATRLKDFYENLPTVRERVTGAGRVLQIRRRAMPDGRVVTIYGDITELKMTHKKMAEGWAKAELANRTKSKFLAHMSHELRTPLNAIIGFSDLICHGILGPKVDEKFLEYIRDIHSSGLHLLEIVNDVLDMSKIEAGKLELAFDWIPVRYVLDEALGMVTGLADGRGLELVTTLMPDDVVIWADERALKQIALNLLSNAIKFSGAGSRVDIRAVMDKTGGVTFEVEDFGIGMTADELQRSLEPFGQAKPITTRTYGGTGLGLPIVKGLVEAHGGSITIESNVGQGTLVRIQFPPRAGAASTRPGLPGAPYDPYISRMAPACEDVME